MTPQNFEQDLLERVKQASANQMPLNIEGGGTKHFLGLRNSSAETVSMLHYQGVIEYEPSELVITVRSGTRLTIIQTLLAENGQILPFEPPLFGADSTIGGVIASGLSGPARPFWGSVRDNLLGCKVLTGNAEILQFGGKVIKNVAGYDITRLMSGSMGSLGILLEVSIKVLPKPRCEVTLSMASNYHEAIDIMCARSCKPLPLSAMCYDGDAIIMRLSGNKEAVADARAKIAGEELEHGTTFWQELNNQAHYFFEDSVTGKIPLWRLSMAPATLPLDIQGTSFLDWGGGLRWLSSFESPQKIRAAVAGEGGHATLFRAGGLDPATPVFHPLAAPLLTYQQRTKSAFDPQKILNRDRFYPDSAG